MTVVPRFLVIVCVIVVALLAICTGAALVIVGGDDDIEQDRVERCLDGRSDVTLFVTEAAEDLASEFGFTPAEIDRVERIVRETGNRVLPLSECG